MFDPLFKKAVTLTDVHFGRQGNSPQANQDNLDFIAWFIEEAKTWGAERCIMMGDWHDNRHSLHVSTMHQSLKAMEMLNEAFEVVHWIPGNHDLFYRDKRDISSISFAKHLPNIKIVDKPTTVAGVTFLPWLIGDESLKLRDTRSRYIFGHLEMGGFMMNAKVEMPETDHGLKASSFIHQDLVFSGHFHIRQQKGKVIYTGNTMPFNFSDNWDEERGMMFLEWGKDPFFKAWPDQPLFRTMRLSELLNKPQQLLKPKMTCRVGIDVDISYEEAQLIKDTFVSDYGLRKIELAPQSSSSVNDQEFTGEVIYQTVDQIVVDGLMSVKDTGGGGIKAETLVEIYKALPNL
jgi:hypothetical protein